MTDSDSKMWFAIVTAEVDSSTPNSVHVSLLAMALERQLVTYVSTPMGITMTFAARTIADARVIGTYMTNTATMIGAIRAGARLSDKVEDVLPRALPIDKPKEEDDGQADAG